MFRSVVGTIFLFMSLNVLALDEVSSISESQQKVLRSITDELGLKSVDKIVQKKIHGTLEFVFKDGWYSYWIGNRDLEKSKFKDDKVRIIELIIPSNERVNIITYTYFPAANQIHYARRQFVEGASSVVMDVFRKSKDSTDLKKFYESDNFAFFQKSGYMDFEIYHVKAPNAGVVYIDYGIIDVK